LGLVSPAALLTGTNQQSAQSLTPNNSLCLPTGYYPTKSRTERLADAQERTIDKVIIA
jgi:hypothetical protein